MRIVDTLHGRLKLRSLKYILYVVLIVFLMLSTLRCGLESSRSYLNPPDVVDIASLDSQTFHFYSTDKNNEPEFQGFELYYKFYTDTTNILADTNYTTLDQLKANGFNRVTNIGNGDSIPLIKVQTLHIGSNFEITVDFSPIRNSSNPEIFSATDSIVSEPVEIGRGVKDVFEVYKPFLDFQTNDLDIGSEIYNSVVNDNTPLFIVLYVLSFGNIFSDYYYSDCEYLGYIDLANITNIKEYFH